MALVAGVELGAVGLQGAAVVHGDTIALDGLAVALDGLGDFDAEVSSGGEGAKGGDENGGETHCEMNGVKWTDGDGRFQETRGTLALVCAFRLLLRTLLSV